MSIEFMNSLLINIDFFKIFINMNSLKKKIGIVGGGQLGKMMILDAKRLGFYVVVLDPSARCPAHSICDEHIVAPFDDEAAYLQLASKVDVITYEFEHINAAILKTLADKGHEVYPSPHSLAIIQDKKTQKDRLVANGIKTPDYVAVSSTQEIYEAGEKFSYPMMLKATLGGYDGKGNAVIKNRESVPEAFDSLGAGRVPLIAEKFCPFEKEVSVLACRDLNGNISVYPVAENIHVDSILDETIVPADITESSREAAMEMAHSVMEVFSDVGMFCTEMFVTKDGDVLLNEVAPRPHNSGHYTIEGCFVSQYEAHIKAITGLKVGDVSLRSPSVMRNILGSGSEGVAVVEGVDKLHTIPLVKLHIYGKEVSKPKRKMGHLTAIASTVDEARAIAKKAYETVRITGLEE